MILTAYKKGGLYEKFLPKFKEDNPSAKIVESDTLNRAEIILDHLTEDIIWVEIDAHITGKIPMPPMKESIGVFFKAGELYTNTMIFKKTKKTESVLLLWKKAIEESPLASQTKLLREILNKERIAVDILSEIYCCMVDAKHCRNPIIQYKKENKSLQPPKVSTVPNSIGNTRIIKSFDGSVSLARKNPEAERWLDKNMLRCSNQLKWIPRVSVEHREVSELNLGDSIYIIGKGPSLSKITKEHFTDLSPVFCINESIHIIEKLNLPNKLYVVFQDSGIKNNCVSNAEMIISSDIANFFPDSEKYVFNPKEWFHQYNYTPIIAINIAKSRGVNKFVMMGFDSFHGDNTYAEEIGYQSKELNQPDRYKTNVIGIKKALEGCTAEFINDEDNSDKLPQ